MMKYDFQNKLIGMVDRYAGLFKNGDLAVRLTGIIVALLATFGSAILVPVLILWMLMIGQITMAVILFVLFILAAMATSTFISAILWWQIYNSKG